MFAAANTKLPDALYSARASSRSRPCSRATSSCSRCPADGKIASLKDIEADGVKLAVGAKDVPIGSYTREVLGKLPASQSKAILGNVRTEEPDVAGITGKLTQGAVDAGFLYASDVQATEGKLKAIELPESLQPTVAYGVAVVKGAKHPEEAKQFIDGLLDGDGAQALQDAGFLPPPTQ